MKYYVYSTTWPALTLNCLGFGQISMLIVEELYHIELIITKL